MNKKKIKVREYANEITKALPWGILLTSKTGDKVDTMTIGWGALGTCWSKPVFICFVREGRFTREQLDRNPEFTVNIPLGKADPKIIEICGTTSGRDSDKIAAAGLTPVEPEKISVPGIKELPLTLECRVVYRQKQDVSLLGPEITERFYPQGVDGSHTGSNRDAHIMYFGEIVDSYIIED